MRERFVVVGLGLFGRGLAEALYAGGHDVIAIDIDEAKVNQVAESVSRAAVGDARNLEVLERIGASDADAAVVSTGQDISASILAVMALHDLAVPEIYVKAVSFDHARILNKIGVTEAVFPEHEMSMNLAQRMMHADSLLNFVRLGGDFGIQEMAVPKAWRGRTLRELHLRGKYGISVVAVRDVLTESTIPVPDPDAPLKDSDTLLIAATNENLRRVAEIE